MSFLDTVDDFADRSVHAVYNQLNVPIGWYDDLASLAAGKWTIYKGQAQPPYTELKIKDHRAIFSPIGNATAILVKQGLLPTWLPATEKQAILDRTSTAPTVADLTKPYDTANLLGNDNLPKILAIAGGAVALLLLLRNR